MPLPATLPLDRLGEPFYTGSVQRLYPIPGDDGHMATETTSRGSVFDVGSIFEIPGSDVARAVFRHVLYSRMADPGLWRAVRETIRQAPDLEESYRQILMGQTLDRLCTEGAATHHAGMIDAVSGEIVCSGVPAQPSAVNVVRRYQILKPRPVRVLGRRCYDYSGMAGADHYVIPLEFIVRFGITGASSVLKKYQSLPESARRSYAQELGVDGELIPWRMLARPINDCTTKHEPEDRAVSLQEALAISGLVGETFASTLELAALGAWAVRHLVEPVGLKLWDLKWEFAREGDRIVFVDTIDTDSMRATLSLSWEEQPVAIHCNKQSMRDFYRIVHPEWLAAVNQAKEEAREAGRNFTEILGEGQKSGRWPVTPVVNGEFLALQSRKLEIIRDCLLGKLEAGEAREALAQTGQAELRYFDSLRKIEDFLRINGIT
jgi:phosphoribosylaminoimidazole-succinocarboxamide synthase